VNGLKHAWFKKEEIYELRKEEGSKVYWQRKDDISHEVSAATMPNMPQGTAQWEK
jgi:hypothetical protein